jgi:hypothetical protein
VVFAGLVASGVMPFECPMRAALGVPCPGCGMTRATHLLAHGDLTAALHMHPLVLVLLPWTGLLLVSELYGHVSRGSFATTFQRPMFRIGSYVVFATSIIVWILRFFGLFGGPCPT